MNNIFIQMVLIDSYRISQPNIKKYTLLSAVDGRFSIIDQFMYYETNLNKFRKIKITPCPILSDNNTAKYKTNSKQIFSTHTNSWKLGNSLEND